MTGPTPWPSAFDVASWNSNRQQNNAPIEKFRPPAVLNVSQFVRFDDWPTSVPRARPFALAIGVRETKRRENVMSVTQTVEASKIEAIPAPFPKTKGDATLKVLNSEQSLGPAVALLIMEPGSEIPRHLHERTTEMSYVLDGDFISEGISYPKGTIFNIKPNTIHGPHTTKTGCSVLVTFSYPSVLDDFKLA